MMSGEWISAVNVAVRVRIGSSSLGGEAGAAHSRLASLPTTRHERRTVDPMAEVRRRGTEAAAAARAATRGEAITVRRTTKPNRWGLEYGDRVDIVGGRYAGLSGTYNGAAAIDRMHVVVDGVQHAVQASFCTWVRR
jgi:hypothetical protein